MIVKLPFSIHSAAFSDCLFLAQGYFRAGEHVGKRKGDWSRASLGREWAGGMGSINVWSVKDETPLSAVGGSLIFQ